MAAFEYQVLDHEGNSLTGTIHADSPRQARQALINQRLIPIQLTPTHTSRYRALLPGRQQKLATSDLVITTRELSTLIEAGEPIDQALDSISQHTHKQSVRHIISAVRADILEGLSLSDALQKHPAAFPDFYIATISAGEHSGKLDYILGKLADYIESRHQTQQKFLLSLTYPAIVTAIAILIVIALLTYVVPQVISVYSDIQQELPWLTTALIAVSDFFKHYLFYICILLLLSYAGFLIAYKNNRFKSLIHRILLSLPLIGTTVREIHVARYCRTLSILLASGVQIIEAMRIATNVLGMIPIVQSAKHAAHQVREGISVRKSLKDTGHFPVIATQLISSGENSGKLDIMLEKAAHNMEQTIDIRIASLLAVFEPLLILAMGGLVLLIVLAVLLPIFDLNQMVSL